MEQSETKEKIENNSALQREEEEEEDNGRTSVSRYPNTADWPLEVGETVWLLSPSFRSVLGEYRITKALPNDEFELVGVNDGTPYSGPVKGRYLKRDPYADN